MLMYFFIFESLFFRWISGKQSQMPNILENSPIYKTFSFEDEMSIGQKILQAERYLEAHSDGV